LLIANKNWVLMTANGDDALLIVNQNWCIFEGW
jgi:hypothetical protein